MGYVRKGFQVILAKAADVMDELKRKAIQDYNNFLRRLFKGYKDDYSFLMNEIIFIENCSQMDSIELIKEYFLNNEV